MSDTSALRGTDAAIYDLIRQEDQRQVESIRLIASENYASAAVLEAAGSSLSNKYSEGYPGRRYYEGQEFIDQIENLAIERAKSLFGATHANVQAYSGSPANQAVFLALLEAGETVMGLGLPFGGHLTHGWKVNFSGKLYRSVQYEVDRESHLIDLNKVEDLAKRERPKLIICGATAYPRTWDFEGFRQIADAVGAVLLADIAHIAGLVVGGAHPHPFPHAEIITSTSHKTLRGPRGALILSQGQFATQLDRAVFPGLQGGPHNQTTAAIAVALHEAASDDFKAYAHQVVANARSLAKALSERGFRLISGGTDNHMVLVDVTPRGINGKPAARALNRAGVECNYNTIPFDPRKPMDPSGLRLGTPAVTTRGMKEDDMETIADWIDRTLASPDDDARLATIRAEVREFCSRFPAPGIRID